MIFADPPYFLSNNGLSIQSGKIVSVNKGKWDKSEGIEYINDFNRKWLTLVREKMKDVWKLPAIAPWEKTCGKHSTQKPLSVLNRIILASTKPNAWILDPFAGSSTTGIAANLTGRRFLGIDQELDFLNISKKRKLEIEIHKIAANYKQRLEYVKEVTDQELFIVGEPIIGYNYDLDLG